MEISAQEYGLNTRVILKEIAPKHIAIVKKIKSRIIQKDALKLIETANKIREKDASLKISLICNNNICSKSLKLLEEKGIEVRIGDE